jgi:probable biosynthetic protein (TIGR04098 family)
MGETVASALRSLIAELAQTAPDTLDFSRRMDEQGIDSLHLIVLRERLQESLRVAFSDEEWGSLDTPAGIAAAIERVTAAELGARVQSGASSAVDEYLEIGMPLTGRNNLAETPLLQYLGDQRWRHITRFTGLPSRDIADEDGHRLYATFFFVETAFPAATPMAAFGENDRFRIVSTLTRFGTSMLDGVSYLVPESRAKWFGRGSELPFGSVAEAVASGVPAVRLSNIFVRQFGGAEWLKKGRPADPRFARIPASADPPDSYLSTKSAERDGTFERCAPPWIPMTAGPVDRDYHLVPDRDLNGAGLVYFANYPMFLDICERHVLRSARPALSDDLLDRRTLVRRRSAYLNNASARDTIRIELEPWLLAQPAASNSGAENVDLLIQINSRMYRRSDERLMMVSTASKVVRAVPAGLVPFRVPPQTAA